MCIELRGVSKGCVGTEMSCLWPLLLIAIFVLLGTLILQAFISTLTSRLTTVEGKWTLTCKINDGTMAVDVDLSNQVLTQMIRFSPKEAQVQKHHQLFDFSLTSSV